MAKIAISLPDEVLDAVERARHAKGESRSQFFRRAVEEHLTRARERADIEKYIRSYQKDPENSGEKAMAEATLHYAFEEDSWEEEFNQ